MRLRSEPRPGPLRRLLLPALLLLAALPARAAWRDPVQRLMDGLRARPDEATLRRLLAATLDFSRPARFILRGQPGATPQAEARLAHALEARFMAEWRRRGPQTGTPHRLEERPPQPNGAPLLARFTPDGDGTPVILGFQVEDMPAGPRIVDFHRDGVSLMRTQRSELGALVQRLGSLEAALAALEAPPRGS
mgnify:FL=1